MIFDDFLPDFSLVVLKDLKHIYIEVRKILYDEVSAADVLTTFEMFLYKHWKIHIRIQSGWSEVTINFKHVLKEF